MPADSDPLYLPFLATIVPASNQDELQKIAPLLFS
jgi:hypothetical protein